jgi:hypothetical protein
VVELVNETLKLENPKLNEMIKECGVFRYILKMVRLYEWNSLLHNRAEAVFRTLFEPQIQQTLGPLMNDILDQCDLGQKVLDMWNNSVY